MREAAGRLGDTERVVRQWDGAAIRVLGVSCAVCQQCCAPSALGG